jgi:hypothetical protein
MADLTNVADAVNDTDATNLAQVNSLIHDMGAVWIGIGSSAVDTGAAVGDFAQATQEGAAELGDQPMALYVAPEADYERSSTRIWRV